MNIGRVASHDIVPIHLQLCAMNENISVAQNFVMCASS